MHLVDLDAGVGFEHLPADVAAALLDEAAERSVARRVAPPVVLVDAGSDRRWALGAGDHADPVTLTGDRPALVGWLTGRATGAGLDVSTGGGAPSSPQWP